MTTKYPNVRLGDGAKLPQGEPGRDLLRRLSQAGKRLNSTIVITSGQRDWRQQHAAYMDYLKGGTLAAPCCSKHWPHRAQDCRRECASNHCRGRAADVEIVRANGHHVLPGNWQEARDVFDRLGLCLPVGSGEVWHVEVGEVWRS